MTGAMDLHPLLTRQLRRVGVSSDKVPDATRWSEVLAAVSRAYRAADEDRYIMERSLELSSAEMQTLHDRLAAERDRLSRELEIARVLQTSLLPPPATLAFLDVAARMVPASEVGGDYYEVIPAPDACWVGIGDVTGHGLRAAIIMLMVQSVVAGIVRACPGATPSEQLARVNAALWDGVHNRLRVDDHVTCTLLRFARDGRVQFAGAHEDLLVSRAGAPCARVATSGTWLAVTGDITGKNPDNELALAPGDLVVLYSDGAIEARNHAGEQLGIDRLASIVDTVRDEPVEMVCERVLAAVQAWAPTALDDVTLVALRYRQVSKIVAQSNL